MRLSIRTERGPRLVSVHRQILSELLGRPLRPEETGEHRCKVPGCWNLDHLEVLPLRDNLARRYAPTAGPWALPDAEHDELQRAADRAWSHRGRRVKRCPF